MKRTLLLCALALSLLFPAAAQAATGLYIGPKLGLSSTKLANNSLELDWNGLPGYNTASVTLGDESQTTFTCGAFFGYNFEPRFNIPIRVELDATFRLLDVDEHISGVVHFNNAPPLPVDMHYEVTSSASGMLNAWFDVPVGAFPVRPYIGGGIGATSITYDIDARLGTGINPAYGSASGADSAFSWMLGAGISYTLNETVTLDLGYRYVQTNAIEVDTVDAYGTVLTVKTSTKSNDVLLNLRFSF